MARIPYKPVDETEPADVVAAMRERRGGQLNEADRMVLHAPAFARGFNLLMGAVRRELSLDADLRELAILGVGVLNGSRYEVAKHVPEYLKAGGRQEKLDALLGDMAAAAVNEALFTTPERMVLQLTLEMTRDVKVSDATFAAARDILPGDQQLVELVGVIASYNMASRILVAMDVEPD